MRYIYVLFAAALLLGAAVANASPRSGKVEGPSYSSIELVQLKKEETVTQKVKRSVKRTWRNLTTTNYAFCARCPIILPLSATTCTARGKNVEEARNICQSQNQLCYIGTGAC